MITKFKNFYILLIPFMILSFNSNLFALEDILETDYVVHEDMLESDLKHCKESKLNNFKDRLPTDRIILIYLNRLLDTVLSSNKEILTTFGRSSDEFCIDINPPTTILMSPFGAMGKGLIYVNPFEVQALFEYGLGIYDSHIVAAISHEMAHDLLNHSSKTDFLKKQIYYHDFQEIQKDIEANFEKGDYEALNIDPDELLDDSYPLLLERFQEFFMTHPDYIKHQQKHEIEADNLGLQIYLNTEFIPIIFGKSYILNEYYYNDSELYPSIPDIFKTISEGDNYITEGIRARKEGRFNEFMESIQYKDPTDTHPSDFWRYWNARDQIEANNIDLDHGIQDNLYFKIDISRSDRLDHIKEFFDRIDIYNMETSLIRILLNSDPIDILLKNFNETKRKFKLNDPTTKILPSIAEQYKSKGEDIPSIIKTRDELIYIISELLNPDSKISFDIESNPDPNINFRKIFEDNNILKIKANDIFRIMVLLSELSALTFTYRSDCVEFFSNEFREKKETKLRKELRSFLENLSETIF